MERGFSPLDEELELVPGSLAPSLVEGAVRLASWMPFGRVPTELGYFTRTQVSEATIRRVTENAGAAYVAVQTAQVEAIERDTSAEGPPGPDRQQLSIDGAMVPLRGKGEWAEVKTLALGTIQPPVLTKTGEAEVHTTELSYFSRLTDHATFGRLATVETYRRGTTRAGSVAAVVDGAEWEQGFIDLHRPDAVRILDFGHAAEYLAKVGKALFGAGTAATSEWLGTHLHELKHGDPVTVLETLRMLRGGLATGGTADANLAVVTDTLSYLEKRQDQIRYAPFQADGYPIGSGIVESANKLLVEARLKGAGMHWERDHVNPMVALRTVACSDRWEEAWPQITRRLREAARERAADRRVARSGPRQAERTEMATAPEPVAETLAASPETPHRAALSPTSTLTVGPSATNHVTAPHRPAANHPWRHQRIGRAQTHDARPLADAKT